MTQTRITTKSIIFLSLFLVLTIWFIPTGYESGALNSLSIVFVSIVLEAIPFMFVGSLIGGLIEAFVSRERLASFLPQRGWLTACIAAGAGIVFPVCERAVVPVIRRLVGKGLPLPAAIGYLLGGPIVNPIVAASTALAYAFDWRVVVLRLALGYGITVCIGILMGRFFSKKKAIKEESQGMDIVSSSCGCAHYHIEQIVDSAEQLDFSDQSIFHILPASCPVIGIQFTCDQSVQHPPSLMQIENTRRLVLRLL